MESEEPTAAGPLVMIIDDSPIQALLLRRMLEELGCRVVEAGGAGQAAEYIERRRPAAVFVELLMDQENGFETCHYLGEKFSVPCVLMSATGRETDRKWAEKLGIAGFLSRPASLDSVRAVMDSLGKR